MQLTGQNEISLSWFVLVPHEPLKCNFRGNGSIYEKFLFRTFDLLFREEYRKINLQTFQQFRYANRYAI